MASASLPIRQGTARPRPQLQRVRGLRDVLFPRGSSRPAQYKMLLLDQFGVLHDGREPYETAVDAVTNAKKVGVKCSIVSNSSRRSDHVMKTLATKHGYDVGLFSGCATSGELVYEALRPPRRAASFKALGTRCVHFVWCSRDGGGVGVSHGQSILAGHGVEAVGRDIDRAQFVLMHGCDGLGASVPGSNGNKEDVERVSQLELTELLAQCAARGLVLLIANPDVVTVDGGTNVIMPGYYARVYDKLGGEFVLMGKPNASIFAMAISRALESTTSLTSNPSPTLDGDEDQSTTGLDIVSDDVLVVGDSLMHDVAGGSRAGLDTLFILSGIHRSEILGNSSPSISSDALIAHRIADLCRSSALPLPTYYCDSFTW